MSEASGSRKGPAPKLSGAALRKLRALGHGLDPVIGIGKSGVTEALVRATDAALETHELIKVKMQREAGDRHEAAIALAARTGSVLAQVLGRTALLYRRHPKKPKIVLPKPTRPASPARGEAEENPSGEPDEAGDESPSPGENS